MKKQESSPITKIITNRKAAFSKSSGRGQTSRRWEMLRAKIRRKDGNKPRNTANSEAGRSALSNVFSEAKERRDKGTQEGRARTEYSTGKRGSIDGWNEEDHKAFMDEARKDEWETGDSFLVKAQTRLPCMLHNEILDHRRWVWVWIGSNSKKRQTKAAEKEAREKEERKKPEKESGTEDEEEGTKNVGVLIAKTRNNYKKDCRRHSRNKIRLVKKSNQKKSGRRLYQHQERCPERSIRVMNAHLIPNVPITRGPRYTRPTRFGSLTLSHIAECAGQ